MPTPYSPGGGSLMPWPASLGAVEVVGDLDQDAGAVAHQLVGADRAAVVEVLEDLQSLLDDSVGLLALDVSDDPMPKASCSSAGGYRPCRCSMNLTISRHRMLMARSIGGILSQGKKVEQIALDKECQILDGLYSTGMNDTGKSLVKKGTYQR